MSVTRPVLRYHGGKWLLAPWVIENMPAHLVYVEPFGGGANVLLRKERGTAECYNDLDGSIVNIFRCLQDEEKAGRLRRRLEFTLYSRAEYELSYEPAGDVVEEACRTIVKSFMGFGSDAATRKWSAGFSTRLSMGRMFPSSMWANWPKCIPDFVDRLRDVVIENRDAAEVMLRLDGEDTLFYADPPYVPSTRSSLRGSGAGHGYRHEMDDDDHRELAKVMIELEGMVMLSGYPSDLYCELYEEWHCLERKTLAEGARPRTECLWFNAAAWERRPQGRMFAMQDIQQERVG
jgi:DNA adenine methylase